MTESADPALVDAVLERLASADLDLPDGLRERIRAEADAVVSKRASLPVLAGKLTDKVYEAIWLKLETRGLEAFPPRVQAELNQRESKAEAARALVDTVTESLWANIERKGLEAFPPQLTVDLQRLIEEANGNGGSAVNEKRFLTLAREVKGLKEAGGVDVDAVLAAPAFKRLVAAAVSDQVEKAVKHIEEVVLPRLLS